MYRVALLMLHWLLSFPNFAFSKTHYIALFPALFSRCLVYSRPQRRILNFHLRPGTSDAFALSATFLQEHYSISQLARLDELMATYHDIIQLGRTPLIIDCGANCGLATAYFADRYPKARVAAIEPDADNVRCIAANTANRNVDTIAAAVTSRRQKLAFTSPNAEKDALRTQIDDTGDLEGLTIPDVLERYPASQFTPFIVKIDIEGFEDDLFATNTDWIADFPLLVIELHDWMLPRRANASNFLKAIAPLNRDFILYRDNIFSIRN